MTRIEPSNDCRLRVLLIEDDADTQVNLSDILDLDGYDIQVAGTAAEGRLLAKQTVPDAIILDRKLPDANADQLLPELRELIPFGDIIIVTGFADIESTIAALRYGASDYILKPINPEALRASLNRISQRRRMERELRGEQQFAERVLRTAEAVILVLNLDGTIVDYNPFFARLTQWPLSELIGKDWFRHFIPAEDVASIRKVFMQTTHDVDTSGIVNEVRTRDGKRRSIRWANTTLVDDWGNTNAVLSVGVDVTAYIAARDRALHAERLATIGQTMAGLAHESRNALQRIQSSLELLSLELTDQPECQEDLAKIGRATRDLNSLLEEVRSYAAPIVLHCKPISLVQIWQRCWRDLESSRQGRDVQLVQQSGEDELIALVDELRMEQVFRNLFENAIAAGTDPVVVSVAGAKETNGDVSITISDNGPGLSHEQQQRIFEPFFTTKSAGTGLGMAIVQRIVLAHQGTIAAQTPSASGAVLTIRLPSSKKKNTLDSQ
ncbi:ATP-binding protein [Planctomycetes bacterium K23_9]|uniref:histidine kinase n=1 Tax=Stieleria marina TaxID=1930275 RepID=A0A517NQW0_9BACT|nr:Sensor histidine kinase TodS [Planctomycetes bacterium K23_9]